MIVSPLNPRCRLTILFDCCHSGSAVELPYVFRPDADGRVNLVNNVKEGISLAKEASVLLHGGFSIEKIHDVQSLVGRGTSLLHKFTHPETPSDESGLADENFIEDWRNEGKDVWMFSGCADDQTSADTSMQGLATGKQYLGFPLGWLSIFGCVCINGGLGAMSWAFINTMRSNPRQSYIQVQTPRESSLRYTDPNRIDYRSCKPREVCCKIDTRKFLNCLLVGNMTWTSLYMSEAKFIVHLNTILSRRKSK